MGTPATNTRVDAVVIGSSTGGPNALEEVLSGLPAAWPVPVFIVQHMPVSFIPLLVTRLAARCRLPVMVATHDQIVEPGVVLVAPGDYHLAVERRGGPVRAVLNQAPTENAVRPAADVLFRSAAAVYGASTLAVVLTGMGYDGLKGCRTLRAQGARILVQDKASSVVWGMPGAVFEAGLADRVLPLAHIGQEIVRAVTTR
jgi:two-component system chemotaxis response regulator CheB